MTTFKALAFRNFAKHWILRPISTSCKGCALHTRIAKWLQTMSNARAERARSKLGLFTVLAAKLRRRSRANSETNRELQERAMAATKSSMLRSESSKELPGSEWPNQLRGSSKSISARQRPEWRPASHHEGREKEAEHGYDYRTTDSSMFSDGTRRGTLPFAEKMGTWQGGLRDDRNTGLIRKSDADFYQSKQHRKNMLRRRHKSDIQTRSARAQTVGTSSMKHKTAPPALRPHRQRAATQLPGSKLPSLERQISANEQQLRLSSQAHLTKIRQDREQNKSSGFEGALRQTQKRRLSLEAKQLLKGGLDALQ